ncbi:MAG: hypothetical protein AAFO69_20960, partial [Bacteroidota bacterium]
MTEKILFFFSALGVFNALLLAVYALLRRPFGDRADYLFVALLTCLIIRVAISCFHYFGPVTQDVIKAGLVANLLTGPLILSLVTILMEPRQFRAAVTWKHLSFWVIMIVFAWFAFGFSTWDWKLRFVIHAVLTFYLIYTGWKLRKELLRILKPLPSIASIKIVALVYVSVVLICGGFALSLVT